MITPEVLKHFKRIKRLAQQAVRAGFAGHYHSAFKGQGLEFEDVRHYQPGDDVRKIDWNVTARTGSPFCKRFVEDRELNVLLVVDNSRSMQFGGQLTKLQITQEITALLALCSVYSQDRVGLLIFANKIQSFIPAKKTEKHVLSMIGHLLSTKTMGDTTNLNMAIQFILRKIQRKTLVIILSDFATQCDQHALATLGSQHEVIAFVVRDELELNTKPLFGIQLCDMETGKRFSLQKQIVGVGDSMQPLKSQLQNSNAFCTILNNGKHLKTVLRFLQLRRKGHR